MKQVIFWGTRGSLPTSITHANIRAKISSALLAANGRSFRKQAELDAFIEALPFAVRGSGAGLLWRCINCLTMRSSSE